MHNKALQTEHNTNTQTGGKNDSNGVTKSKIDYILTNRPDISTDITVINQVNIGSDHRLVMSKTRWVVEVESKTVDE